MNNFKPTYPKVSVIIPNYNYAHIIEETLSSVRLQSYTNFECIIVDDGSSDNSVEVIQEFIKSDNRFSLLQKTNGGLPSTRNEGMKIAKGDYIAFLDADDLWLPNKLKNQIEFFEKKGCDVVFSKIQNFSNSDDLGIFLFNQKELTVYDFLASNPIPGGSSNFMIKKAVFQKVGFYNNDLRSSEDLHYYFKIALHDFKFCYSNTLDVKIRKHETSMSYNFLKMYLGKLYCFELSLEALLKEIPEINKEKLKQAYFSQFQSLLWTDRDSGRKELIYFTYTRFKHLLGWRFYFTKTYIINKKYDILQNLRDLKKRLL